MIFRMSRGMHRSDSCTRDLEDLIVFDVSLALFGVVLVDAALKVWVEAKKIFHSASVITVPVGQENMG